MATFGDRFPAGGDVRVHRSHVARRVPQKTDGGTLRFAGICLAGAEHSRVGGDSFRGSKNPIEIDSAVLREKRQRASARGQRENFRAAAARSCRAGYLESETQPAGG